MQGLFRFFLTLTLVIAGAVAALAAEENPPVPTPAPTAAGFYTHAVDNLAALGPSSNYLMWTTRPFPVEEGTFGLQASFNHRRFNSRYKEDGTTGYIWGPFVFSDPFGGPEKFFQLRTKARGYIDQVNLELNYGFTDQLSFFFACPFQMEKVRLYYTFFPGSSADLGIRTIDDLFRFFELFGRPRPIDRYESKTWEPGDFRAGFSWNYFRSPQVELALTGQALFPTGRLADPNQALIYALGPQIDAGLGSYTPRVTHTAQFQLPGRVRWLGFVAEGSYQYSLRGKRRSPHWLIPDPTYADFWPADSEERNFLPDLSHMDDYYFVTPGSQVDALGGLTFSLAYFSAGLGYSFNWTQKPMLDADDNFKDMLNTLEAYQSAITHTGFFQVGVPLAAVRVPGVIGLSYRYPFDGRNALRYEDDVTFKLQFLFPL